MATKNCPHCSKQVPVACKKCGCGHVFFVTRRSATSINRENCEDEDMPTSPTDEKPTRRSGRITRERPNFYDALQYENQTRRQKQQLRQSKQGKSEEPDEGSDEGELLPQSSRTQPSQEKSVAKDPKSGEPKPKKKRGRPPGITGRKPNQGYKITATTQASRTRKPSSGLEKGPDSPNSDSAHDAADKALIQSISPEKALQYNIVLQDINTKIGRVGWRAQ